MQVPVQGILVSLSAHLTFALVRSRWVNLQVPLQRIVGLHCAHLVP